MIKLVIRFESKKIKNKTKGNASDCKRHQLIPVNDY